MTKQIPPQAQDNKCPYSPQMSLSTPLDGITKPSHVDKPERKVSSLRNVPKRKRRQRRLSRLRLQIPQRLSRATRTSQ